MTRSRASAKKAGSSFERSTADFLRDTVDDRIDRQVKTGSKDTGDIANVRLGQHKIAVECKNEARTSLATWMKEVEQERVNLGALAGVVVHKRVGRSDPGDQWVTMTLRDLASMLSGERVTWRRDDGQG